MSTAVDRTPLRWLALAALVGAVALMIAPTLPYSGSGDGVTRVDHWYTGFSLLPIGGGANFAVAVAVPAVLIALVGTALAAFKVRVLGNIPGRAPAIWSAIAAVAAAVATAFGGGHGVWAWVAVALMAGAAVANGLAGRRALPETHRTPT